MNPRPRRTSCAWLALVVGACLLRFLWIGDVPFIVDEPRLLAHALRLNADGHWAVHGLAGSQIIHYGPLPAWIYQTAVALSADPMRIALWKTGVVTALTVWALYAWGRLLPGGSGAFLWIGLLSPYYWKMSRDFWDISWTIPLALLAWTGYLTFDARPSRGRLVLVLASLTGLVLTHLVSLPVVAAIATHLLWVHRSWLWTHRRSVLAVSLLCLAVAAPYLHELWRSRAVVVDPHVSVWSGLSGLLMFQPLTVFGIEGSLAEEWWRYPGFGAAASPTLAVLRWVSLAGGVVCFAGMGVAAAGVLARSRRAANRGLGQRRVRLPRDVERPQSQGAEGNRGAAARTRTEVERVVATADGLALAAFALWAPLAVLKGLGGFSTNYFNPFVPVVLHFAWRGAGLLNPPSPRTARRWVLAGAGRGLLAAWAISLGVCLVAIQWRVHDGEGTRGLTWGPTLRNQWDIARQLARLPTPPRMSRPERPPHFPDALDVVPFALDTLRQFAARSVHVSVEPSSEVEVQYRQPSDPWNGAIVFRVQPAVTAVPGGNP